MDEKQFGSLISHIFGKNDMGKYLSFARTQEFYKLTQRLITENEKYNLTAITDPERVILLHYVDSLTIAPYIKKNAKVIDIGTGAGFPSLPLAICREDLHITAADATEKRVRYVGDTAAMLGLSNLTAITLRAEAGGRDPKLREQFDVACARGVSNLRVLCEYCLPYVKVGGLFIAMKGQGADREAHEAKRAIAMLGGKLKAVVPCPLTDGNETVGHQLVLIEKISATGQTYPRDNSQITKKPL